MPLLNLLVCDACGSEQRLNPRNDEHVPTMTPFWRLWDIQLCQQCTDIAEECIRERDASLLERVKERLNK